MEVLILITFIILVLQVLTLWGIYTLLKCLLELAKFADEEVEIWVTFMGKFNKLVDLVHKK
jgi:hypothetical protein